jgi:hypothetical protein
VLNSTDRTLGELAAARLRSARFAPARVEGRAVAYRVRWPVAFNPLDQREAAHADAPADFEYVRAELERELSARARAAAAARALPDTGAMVAAQAEVAALQARLQAMQEMAGRAQAVQAGAASAAVRRQTAMIDRQRRAQQAEAFAAARAQDREREQQARERARQDAAGERAMQRRAFQEEQARERARGEEVRAAERQAAAAARDASADSVMRAAVARYQPEALRRGLDADEYVWLRVSPSGEVRSSGVARRQDPDHLRTSEILSRFPGLRPRSVRVTTVSSQAGSGRGVQVVWIEEGADAPQ